MTVTVVRTITEHTNGRREKESGGGWERRTGVREIPTGFDKRGRKTVRRETIWEDCEAPVKCVYGSPEHIARREAGKGGGTLDYEWSGLETLSAQDDLNRDELEMVLRSYVHKFVNAMRDAEGARLRMEERQSPAEAMREARRVAKRVEELFGMDLWATNLSEC